ETKAMMPTLFSTFRHLASIKECVDQRSGSGTAPDCALAETRRYKSLALRRSLLCSKLSRGPFHLRSSTESNTGTSSRKVASVRYSNASSQAANNDSESGRARRIEGSQPCQSFGMLSRCRYRDNASDAAFAPHPEIPGYPSALSPVTAR